MDKQVLEISRRLERTAIDSLSSELESFGDTFPKDKISSAIAVVGMALYLSCLRVATSAVEMEEEQRQDYYIAHVSALIDSLLWPKKS